MTTHTSGTRRHCLVGVAIGAADWLRLAAAPTFAAMAVLTGVLGGGVPDALCAHDASPLSGMVAMYWLMSAFHLAPWLKLISSRLIGNRATLVTLTARRPALIHPTTNRTNSQWSEER